MKRFIPPLCFWRCCEPARHHYCSFSLSIFVSNMDLTSSKLLNDVFYTSECCRCSASPAPRLWRLINCDTSLLGENTKSSSQSHPSSLCLLSRVFCVNLTALMRSLGATPPFMQPRPWGSYRLSGPIDSSSLPLGPPPSCPFMVPTWNEPLCLSAPLPFLRSPFECLFLCCITTPPAEHAYCTCSRIQ